MQTTTNEPTREQFDAYLAMFSYFNRTLFKSELPSIVLNFSRHARSYGFFAPERWSRGAGGEKTHELSLNPDHLVREARATASTLVHEMCHLWQQEHGTPPRRGYHDKEWSQKMQDVGLMPSDTGEAGDETAWAPRMTHYIVEGGAFAKAFASMPAEYLLPWSSGALVVGTAGKTVKKRDPSKVKYTCEGCGTNVWGKIGLRIQCSICEEEFEEVA